jgi:curli biogenesis system outer membrane secretion channel CsgG
MKKQFSFAFFLCLAMLFAGEAFGAGKVTPVSVEELAGKHQERRKLVVAPFAVMESTVGVDGESWSDGDIGRKFAQATVTELTQSRRFVVVDREYVEEYLAEKGWIFNRGIFGDNFLNAIAGVGADLVLVGTVSDFTVFSDLRTIQLTGEAKRQIRARAKVDYRLIDMSTRQVLWSDTAAVMTDRLAGASGAHAPSVRDVVDETIVKVARAVVRSTLDSSFPVRVVSLAGNGEVVLNQGGVTVSQGDLFDVFLPGKKVREVYSGESLGRIENRVATIRVVRVLPKMSYAVVDKGDYALVVNGAICRRVGDAEGLEPAPDAGRPADIRFTEGGGVRLPFDK